MSHHQRFGVEVLRSAVGVAVEAAEAPVAVAAAVAAAAGVDGCQALGFGRLELADEDPSQNAKKWSNAQQILPSISLGKADDGVYNNTMKPERSRKSIEEL